MANDSEILLLAIEQLLDEHRREGGLRGRSYDTGLVLLAAARLGPNPASPDKYSIHDSRCFQEYGQDSGHGCQANCG